MNAAVDQGSHASQVVGYLVSEYPATSHTFIRREIEAMRAEGLSIATYSVRRASVSASNPIEVRALEETFSILGMPKLQLLAAALRTAATNPVRTVGTLRLALRHRVPGLRALIWSLFHLIEALVLADRLRKDGVRHLHNHFGNSGATVGMLAAHHAQIPWSLTLHGISEFDYPAGNLLAEKLSHARFAACVSYFGMAQAMRLASPKLWDRLFVVRCAIDPADLPAEAGARAAATQMPAAPEQLKLICVGRLSPEKGHAGLLQVFSMVAKKRDRLHLEMVGDGPELLALKAQAGVPGLEGRVTFAGRLDEPATLAAIARSDILVLPSFMEGLPIVIMEAMALGVPVIASRVAGIPEIIDDGESGLLFDPANWPALARAIERLADDAGLRDRLAEAGKIKVAREFVYPAATRPLAAAVRASLAGSDSRTRALAHDW